jgi:phosphate transport system substrate-binding protein
VKTRGALGWMTLAQLVAEDLKLAPLPIDGIKPSQANFASGTYPLFKPLLVVTGAHPTPLTQAFLEFLSSAEGRAILVKNGNFPDVKQP